MGYTESFRENAVSKLLMPGSMGLNATAEKLGIPSSTLYGWKARYAIITPMKKTNKKNTKNWSPEEKLEALVKTASMSESNLGEYLRINGLHSHSLESFKSELIAGISSKGRPKLDPEVVELRKKKFVLERDLRRTKSALAEQSARIILLKKSHEIWGDPEDEK